MKAGALPVVELRVALLAIAAVTIIMIIAGQIDARNAYRAGWSNGFFKGLDAKMIEVDEHGPVKRKRKSKRDTGA